MKVIKRDGTTVDFDRTKIIRAIQKANEAVDPEERISEDQISAISNFVQEKNRPRLLVEDIQDMVEHQLMELGKYTLAKAYIIYRYTRALVRKQNTTDESILSLLRNTNKELAEENSNKNTVIASTQRDYIAGEVSRDLTRRILLPEKISQGPRRGHPALPRRGLLCPAHLQLLPHQHRRHAGQRHHDQRQDDREPQGLPGGLQRHDPDHCQCSLQPVWRPERGCEPSGQVSAPEPGKIPPQNHREPAVRVPIPR